MIPGERAGGDCGTSRDRPGLPALRRYQGWRWFLAVMVYPLNGYCVSPDRRVGFLAAGRYHTCRSGGRPPPAIAPATGRGKEEEMTGPNLPELWEWAEFY